MPGGNWPVPGRGQRAVGAEKLGIRYVFAAYCPIFLPSPHHRPQPQPQPLPGRPLPPEVTAHWVLNDLAIQNHNAMLGEVLNSHRVSIGLPPVDNVRDHVIGDQPAGGGPGPAPWREPTDLNVVQTGAWALPDERPLPAELVASLDAGARVAANCCSTRSAQTSRQCPREPRRDPKSPTTGPVAERTHA